MNLVTPRPDRKGGKVQKVLIEEGLDIRKELYLGIVIDRQTGKPVFMASASGGMDIEEVAAKNPEADPQGIHRARSWAAGVSGAKAWRSVLVSRRN